MKFRRSVKSEKHDSSKPVPTSLPQKDAIAIEPPKKVIKALYEWNGHEQADMYLSFGVGDFLHVVSRENDEEWYEACNPLKNERGLVPVKFFELVGKTVRDSGGSRKSLSATHDSGYAEGTGKTSGGAPPSVGANGVPSFVSAHRMSKSGGKYPGSAYATVIYDFHAERPDELEAKEGEAIIVVAQSNPEWFVAKPVARLGGPGLIPVSFVEIRDKTTGMVVADPLEEVQKLNVPRVEEWKKIAADYKNGSIALGILSTSSQMQGLQQGMDRMSIGNGQSSEYGSSRQESGMSLQQQQQQNLFAPLRASVPRYIYADDKFHFIVECKLSNGTHWDLSRIYEDFYELQINLINAFPEEAGQVPGRPRILPYMPGPVKFVTDNISEGRRANLDEYLRDLLKLQQYITSSSLVRNFFAPRPTDYEVDLNSTDLEDHARSAQAPQDRYSRASYSSQQVGAPQQQPIQNSSLPSHQQTPSQASNAYGHQRQQQSMASIHSTKPVESHYRSPSEAQHSTGAALTTQSHPQQPAAATSASTLTGPVKVKAWYDRDTCVVIRMPPRGAFDFDALYQKIAERRRLEYRSQQQQLGPNDEELPLEIEYRDEIDEEYYRLEGDEDLEIALSRNEKLTLAVRKGEEKQEGEEEASPVAGGQ